MTYTKIIEVLDKTVAHGPRGGLVITWLLLAKDGNTYQRIKRGKQAIHPPARVEQGKGIHHTQAKENDMNQHTTNGQTNGTAATIDRLEEVASLLESTIDATGKEIVGQVKADITEAAERIIRRRQLASALMRMDDEEQALETVLVKIEEKRLAYTAKLNNGIAPAAKALYSRKLAALEAQEQAILRDNGLLLEDKTEPARGKDGKFTAKK